MADLFTGNPYLRDPRFQLSDEDRRAYQFNTLGSALTNLGAGIASTAGSGQPWFAGIAPGAQMASRGLSRDAASLSQQQMAAMQYAQMEDYRKAQEEALKATTDIKRKELEMDEKFFGGGGVPGLGGFQPSPVQMGAGATGPPVDLKTQGAPMVDYLTTKHGFSPVASAGIVGNLFKESSFNPAASGDGGTSMGLAQWRGERAAGLQKFAQAQGKPATDPQVQLDYLVAEMKGGDMGAQRAYAMLQRARTPQEAAAAMMHFERPRGYTPANPTGGDGFQQRVQYAQALLPGGAPVVQGGDGGGTGGPQAYVPQSANPQIAANPGGNVMPPRIDPLQFLPLAGGTPRMRAYGTAGIAIGNKETDRYLADQDRAQKQAQFAQEQALREAEAARRAAEFGVTSNREQQNAAVGPNGEVQQGPLQAKAQTAAAEADVRQAAEGERMAIQERLKLYNEGVRPKAVSDATNLYNNYRSRQLLDAGAQTGPGVEATQGIRQAAAAWLGIDEQGAATTSALMSQAKKRLLDRAKALGANPSNYEDKIMSAAQGADLGNSPAAMRMILQLDEDLTRRELKNHDTEAGIVKKMKFSRGGRPLEELYGSEAFAVPGVPGAYADWQKENPLPGVATKPPPTTPGAMPAPKSKEERDALPPGTPYRAPDGSIKVRP